MHWKEHGRSHQHAATCLPFLANLFHSLQIHNDTHTHTHIQGSTHKPGLHHVSPSWFQMLACSSLSVTKPPLQGKRNSSGCICTAGRAGPIPAKTRQLRCLWWLLLRSEEWKEIWGVVKNTPQAGSAHSHFLLYCFRPKSIYKPVLRTWGGKWVNQRLTATWVVARVEKIYRH